MWRFDNRTVPDIHTALPGPKAKEQLGRDALSVSPSYTRAYPLVVESGSGAVIEDVDGNLFLDFTAGIAVNATGHCHPEVVAAIQDQAAKLIHMSGTDFYYLKSIWPKNSRQLRRARRRNGSSSRIAARRQLKPL